MKRSTNKLLPITILLLLLSAGRVLAQQKIIDTLRIDSNRFSRTRKQMDLLSIQDFSAGTFNYQNQALPYRLLPPQRPQAKKRYPLVITFHNSSRIGSDNSLQLENLAKTWLRKDIRESYPCYVLAPHFSKRSSDYSPDPHGVLISRPSPQVETLSKLIDSLILHHPDIDDKRIYLIGYSMGGSTAQNLLRYRPGRFAAILSIAAVPDTQVIPALKKLPVWLIHGQGDNENPYAGSEILYQALAKNKSLRFTSFTQLNHNNILMPYLLTDEIARWLFSWHR